MFFLMIAVTQIFSPVYAAQENAVSTSSPSFYKTGIYIGAFEGFGMMGGGINHVWDDRAFQTAQGFPPGFLTPFNAKKFDTKFVSEILLGGRYLCQNGFFPGIDVSISFANHRIQVPFLYPDAARNRPVEVTISNKYRIISSFVLGYVFQERFQVFAKLGIGIASFESKLFNPNEIPPNNFQITSTKYGVAPALGLEYAFNPSFSIVGSISYERYQNIDDKFLNVIRQPVPADPDNIASNKTAPSFFTQKIGLMFKF
jgi:opacity protein-like surface antigen